MKPIAVNLQKRKNLVVTQSNKLTEARYFLTLGEQKVILLLISMISPEDTDFKSYEIKISDFADVMGLKSHNVYERISEVLDKLLSRVLHIPKDTGYLKIGWISSAEYIEGTGTVQLSFDDKLKPYLLQLKDYFKSYNLFVVTQFKSAYSIRIYMLLKQYEKIGTREFKLEELREILGIQEKEYPRFADFRRRVIDQARKEFEQRNKHTRCYQSDISFDLETIREKRKITKLRFIIKKQSYQEPLPFDLPEKEPLSKSIEILVKHGIGESLARKYEVEQGEEEVLRCVQRYEEKLKAGKVENKGGGYLLRMLNDRAGKKTESEKFKEEQEKKKQQIEQEAQELEELKESYTNARNEAINGFLNSCDKKSLGKIISAFESSDLFANEVKAVSFVRKKYEENGVESPMVASYYKRFLVDNYLSENLYLQSFEQWLEHKN